MGVPQHAARPALVLALILAACSGGGGDGKAADDAGPATTTTTQPVALPSDYQGYTSAVYSVDANWLCEPGRPDDACGQDLDATAVQPDGTTKVLAHEPAEDPGIDCFYV